MLDTPVPNRTLKLSNIGPGDYLDGRPFREFQVLLAPPPSPLRTEYSLFRLSLSQSSDRDSLEPKKKYFQDKNFMKDAILKHKNVMVTMIITIFKLRNIMVAITITILKLTDIKVTSFELKVFELNGGDQIHKTTFSS